MNVAELQSSGIVIKRGGGVCSSSVVCTAHAQCSLSMHVFDVQIHMLFCVCVCLCILCLCVYEYVCVCTYMYK